MRGAFVRPLLRARAPVCVCMCARAAEERAGRRDGGPFGICLEGGFPAAWTWSKNSHSSTSAFGKCPDSEVIDSSVHPGWGIISRLDFTSLWPEALPASPAVCVCLSGQLLSWRQPGVWVTGAVSHTALLRSGAVLTLFLPAAFPEGQGLTLGRRGGGVPASQLRGRSFNLRDVTSSPNSGCSHLPCCSARLRGEQR